MSGLFPYGQKAKELVMELKRSDWLPKYNDDTIRQIVDETKEIHHNLGEIREKEINEYACPLYFYIYCARRNKRCLLSYLDYRMKALMELRWKTGTIIIPDMKSKLHSDEVRYFEKYDEILNKYMDSTGLDICAYVHPPKNLYIEVRVLKDYGEIMVESGVVNLEKDTTHFLRRCDVEHLICQNVLKQIS